MALWLHTGMQLVAIYINNAYFAKFAFYILHSPFCWQIAHCFQVPILLKNFASKFGQGLQLGKEHMHPFIKS